MSEHTMSTRSLLVELQTEELPPKALEKMGVAFADGIAKVLRERHLLADNSQVTEYATPRRLAVHITDVAQQAADQAFSEKLMPTKVGIDAQGNMTVPLQKRLEGKGLGHLSVADLEIKSDGKQDYLYANGMATGAYLADVINEAIDYAVTHLPIPKVMRYQLNDGITSVRFVRPAHGLIVLWGDVVLPAQTLGLESGRQTLGHRFMADAPLTIRSADSYVEQLEQDGWVVPSFAKRREQIRQQLEAACRHYHASLGNDPEVPALLEEVTALVEHPTVYKGEFDPIFLEVPSECLILTMRLNQRYFPLFNPDTQALTHQFLIVSNMQVEDPTHIIEGNQRVILPRLADARFFFDTDRKQRLADRLPSLDNSVYHNKLGSQRVRVERLRRLATYLADQLGADRNVADRAALLAKADLNTLMVGEFPELQGIMGAYYAEADGEDAAVVNALKHQYEHRIQQAVTPDSLIATLLFLAERAETLVGIWGIGLAPTGERDPYALRRAALGLISAFEQLNQGGYFATHSLDLRQLLEYSAAGFEPGVLADNTVDEVMSFIYERYRNQLVQQADRKVVEAVLALRPPLQQVQARVHACIAFAQRPEAESLAAANKRVSNLLQRHTEAIPPLNPQLLHEPAEQVLAQQLNQLAPVAQQQFNDGDFTASLATLAAAKDPVDQFFNDVMVMAEDPAVRNNRLALLKQLHQAMNQVADLSLLA
ncbi:MAG TPA: glycine--tRNA ligase subunit beta [Paenalcaligenes hominis]|uniref:Glycine--tRNA ligase beta subunit n=1 Tax=Paenalcaligenes hominis TaxID=643674 RepID=A0A9D2VEA1_9BURK|nr:glycine--tRNA ligase subunit beta [Paenalcaligenes hominis]